MQWIQQGVYLITPKNVLNMLDWEEIECRAAGDKELDIEKLKSITEYHGCDENNQYIQRFWKILTAMTEEQK